MNLASLALDHSGNSSWRRREDVEVPPSGATPETSFGPSRTWRRRRRKQRVGTCLPASGAEEGRRRNEETLGDRSDG